MIGTQDNGNILEELKTERRHLKEKMLSSEELVTIGYEIWILQQGTRYFLGVMVDERVSPKDLVVAERAVARITEERNRERSTDGKDDIEVVTRRHSFDCI